MGGTKVLWLLRGWKGGLQKFSGKERRRSRGFRSSGRAVGEAAPPPPPFPLNVLSLILSHSLRARVFSHRCRCCCIKKSRRGGGGGCKNPFGRYFGRRRQDEVESGKDGFSAKLFFSLSFSRKNLLLLSSTRGLRLPLIASVSSRWASGAWQQHSLLRIVFFRGWRAAEREMEVREKGKKK